MLGSAKVKRFGIYKARVEGLVAVPKDPKKSAGERSKCAIVLKMSGGAYGKICLLFTNKKDNLKIL